MGEKIDLLDRGVFVNNVLKIVNQLSENKKGCCFAIEGSWGIGKTFVIEELESQLKNVQSEETAYDKYFVFSYNCWKYDYYEEPAVAIISAMLSSLQDDKALVSEEIDGFVKAGGEIAKEKLKEIAGLYIENKIGVNLISLFQDAEEKRKDTENKLHEFDELFNFGKTMDRVRKCLQEIAKVRTLVLIVDELDRCIPSYAIKVLERLHHIFDGLENVVIIMAIDRKQLEHSVEEMFGARTDENAIDIEKYLKKFIDFSLLMDNGKINDCLEEKYKYYFDKFESTQEDKEELVEIIIQLLEGIDIRRQKKIIEKANMIHSLVSDKTTDISLLGFEVMYSIMKEWQFSDWNCITRINDQSFYNIENTIGYRKLEVLKKLEVEARQIITTIGFDSKVHYRKCIRNTLCGKMFWFFSEIFCEEENKYDYDSRNIEGIKKELEIASKYCELCKIIQ